ncbi:glycosyltransferase [Cytobacillus firmus]|uniref:Family 2 glycosyl transferase n=1 Tax=Cytobacillus firmus DS1 TaxID=1307436 RepID=W7L6V4_CYTFI|nr:glycosyltransferase family 2 protein [Cytobacillus firmus]EWG10947.1 family 2 glycosyl transferase [Cytobacillus firmus DS1]
MLLFLIISLTLFLLWTLWNMSGLPSLPAPDLTESSHPPVTILVPLRNEERNVSGLISSLKSISYPNVEIILLDDGSRDRTLSLLRDHTAGDSRFKIVIGTELPSGWAGKVYACHQLQREAKGDYFLFLDADVRLSPDLIEKALALLKKTGSKLLTGFPSFEVPGILSKLLIPMMHFVVLFHLPIRIANKGKMISATAANGAFMLFERKAYQEMGGHYSVQSSIVEDVQLAKNMKTSGFSVCLADISDDISCRMYERNSEVWEGFVKNIFSGLGRSVPMVILLSLFYACFYVLPGLLLLYGLWTLQPVYALPCFLTVLQRMAVDWKANQRLSLSFFMPLSAVSLIIIMNASMWRWIRKKPYSWKGRHYT